ncbi:isoprenylcysteine carboxylmethyltransferase family protein [Mycobacterium sp. ACS4331]|uniref:methyltransferase family protein n=1 Tax=Mycobacterium sp. ACS4331 TaxID=1834121 RepID=UPI0007FD3092|nr:isoprenylcysteine carboxylmethyltransferase family protein [Mycobacterium sp. ACS4331]OBF27461.1 hypothetical protein A5727_26380 [Mycobacterium sp. ACS4331]
MKLALQTVASAIVGFAFFALALFLPAGTWHYWQAWVFIAVFAVSTFIPTIYLAITDPAALQRRLRAGPTAETRPAQRIIMTATVGLVVAILVLSALDHRFGWSQVPFWLIVVGDVFVAVGLTAAQGVVVIANRFAGASITVESGQRLVTTGPYRMVRHPMYSSVLVMMVGMPLALDSFWALALVPPGLLLLATRIRDEERLLSDELAGYRDYAEKVRYRLVPRVW